MGRLSFNSFLQEHSEVLTEAISAGDFAKVSPLIVRYLAKYIGRVFYFPAPEIVTVGGVKYSGVRFFFRGKSFRLNWKINKISQAAGLVSMDYWDGTKLNPVGPTYTIVFDEMQSLVKVLPFIKEYLIGNIDAKDTVFFDESKDAHYAALNEASYPRETVRMTVVNMVMALKKGISIGEQSRQGGSTKYGPRWNQAQAAVKQHYGILFKRVDKSLVIDPSLVDKIDVDKIVDAVMGEGNAVAFQQMPGKREKIEVEGAEEEDMDRMSYEEQLDSLKTGMKLLMSNATNALFLGGRGGTGKTQTVEDMLHAAGLSDGEGYFKITGSATPTGIYRILHDHKNEIILFDDSDSALADQEGRNLFKAASDTKKKRKLSWMKGGKNFVSPEEYEESGGDDENILPRSFEFTGKIIFISNLPLDKLDPDGALRTRGYVISIDPTNQEIYDFMEKIVNKIPLEVDYSLSSRDRIAVIEVLRSRKIKDKSANLRSLVRGLNTCAGVKAQGGSEEEWRRFVRMFA
ncbi:MAG: hypothetical protein EBU08_08815 [Micrococcales bacterium]|nr:hypothetical protein [Micrococcales bacterium]